MSITAADFQKALSDRHASGQIVVATEARESTLHPASWTTIVTSTDWRRELVSAWGPTLVLLPSVRDFILRCLHQPLILDEGDRHSLLYPFTSDGTEISFFRGMSPSASPTTTSHESFPPGLSDFYRQTHDGWTFLSSNAMGPLPSNELEPLSERLDMSEEEIESLPYRPDSIVPIFHNGMGDYLCWARATESTPVPHGVIWWHEEPEQVESVDFWMTMNAWIGIFLESADPCSKQPG